jgi:hypothetical protein
MGEVPDRGRSRWSLTLIGDRDRYNESQWWECVSRYPAVVTDTAVLLKEECRESVPYWMPFDPGSRYGDQEHPKSHHKAAF